MNKTQTLPFIKGFQQAKDFLLHLKQIKIQISQNQQAINMSPIVKGADPIFQEDNQVSIQNSPQKKQPQRKNQRIMQLSKQRPDTRHIKSHSKQKTNINVKIKTNKQQTELNKIGKKLQRTNKQITQYNCILHKLKDIYGSNMQINRENQRLRKEQLFLDCQIMKWQKQIQGKKAQIHEIKMKKQRFEDYLQKNVKKHIKNVFTEDNYYSERSLVFQDQIKSRFQIDQSKNILKRYYSQTKKSFSKESQYSQNIQESGQSSQDYKNYELNLKFNLMKGDAASKGSLKQIPISKKLFQQISIDQEVTIPYQQW